MVAFKVGGEGGDALCQYQVGIMYYFGQGVDLDYKQALLWVEKAAAQDRPDAVGTLGAMYCIGQGVTPSWRRAQEYTERGIELGDSRATQNMQDFAEIFQEVTSQQSNHSTPSPLVHDITSNFTVLSFSRTHRPPLSWTSGWRSTARAGRT